MDEPTPRASESAASSAASSQGDETAARNQRRRHLRGRLLYGAIVAVSNVVRRLPLRFVRRIGGALGRLASHVARRDRRIALDNIAASLPELSPSERHRVIRDMFRHLGMSFFEILWLRNLRRELLPQTTSFEGLDRIQDLIAAGRSIVVFTGHCGNWEWLACAVGIMSDTPVSVMQRERDEAQVNDFIVETRARVGIRTIGRGSQTSGRELIQAVRKPGILAFLIDQNIRAESAKVPFFGRPALTPIGPAKLAIRAGSIVVTAFIERRNGRQLIRFGDPHETARDDDPIALTALLTNEIEAQIRRAPEQWVWMHQRWRERPQWDVANDATR